MKERLLVYPEKWLLMLSGIAFLLLIIPAWSSGFVWGGVWAAAMCLCVLWLPMSRQRVRGFLYRPGMLCVAAVICGALTVNFYNTWRHSGYVQRIADILSLTPEWLVIGLGILGSGAALPAVGCVLSYFSDAYVRELNSTKQSQPKQKGIHMAAAVAIVFAVYVLGISAILRANFLYRDDFGRYAFGYKQWDYFSRYLSTGLASLIHMGDYLVDIAPLPQLLAMLFLACAGVWMLYILYDRTRFTVWELAALVPLGLNPYFLECISYRFDAPYMAVSVLLAVMPLLFRNGNRGAYLFASMMSVLLVCTGYQAASGVFPILVILLAMRKVLGGEPFREALGFALRSAVGYGLGLVFFKLVIMRPADAGYVSNALPAAGALIPNTLAHLKEYYALVLSDFKFFWLLLVGLLVIGFVFTAVMGTKGKKLPALGLVLLCLVLMGVLCYGLYPFLADTIFAPRAMYGFGILLTLLCIVTAEGKHIPLKMPGVLLAWVFFVFSFTYGNALYAQKEYTDFRINLVLSDINELEIFQTEEDVTVQLSGDIGKAPVIRNMPDDYGMLTRLLPITFGSGEDWGKYGFYYYYDLPNVEWNPEVDLRQMDLPVLEETMYHTIRGRGNYVLIELK